VTPELWEEVQALFAEAMELDRNEWEGFVRSQASGSAVAEEVLALLDAHGQESPFDSLTTEESRGRENPGRAQDQRVGPWEIVGELGEGGMGTVYLVRRSDGQFDQQGALKILSAHLSGREAESRFLAERQILARLEHPQIARLLDGGLSPDGRPYFVMEYVQGLPIHRYCEERGLDVVERLRLFIKVCGAVQYAHQNLIVHRDLKPSNILITKEGEPKLLDFGIAKLLDDSFMAGPVDATRVGTRLLTPGYASPEQFSGLTVTTATDVYQLGVLLYEGLVGRRPYTMEGAGQEGAGVPPTGSQPARPSRAVLTGAEEAHSSRGREGSTRLPDRGAHARRLSRRLRGDLDDIVLKALRPEPDRRYGTAGELADDLDRHLRGRPVRARPDTLAYRTAKFVRRNALPLSAAFGGFLLVAGFGIGMSRQARRTAVERDRAEQVVEFLVGLFRSADPALARGDTITVREILDVGVVRVREELARQPEVQATLLEVLGEVYGSLGLLDPALGLMRESVQALRTTDGAHAADLARTLRRLAVLSAKAGRFQDADTLLPLAEGLTRDALDPGSLEYARALTDIGFSWQVRGRLELAEPLLEEALQVREAGGFPAADAEATLVNLGWLRRALNDPDSAEALFRRALTLREEKGGEGDLGLATSLEGLGRVLVDRGSLEAADSAISEALRIRLRILPREHHDIAGLLSQRGTVLLRHGRPDQAEPLFREVIEAHSAALGPDHFLVADARNDLALTLQELGRQQEAVEQFRQAWDGYRRQFGEAHSNTAVVESNLARALFRLDALPEAEKRFAHALAITREAFPGARWVAGDQVSLGLLRCRTDEFPVALADLREARDALRPPEGERGPDDYLRAVNALGSCLARHGEREEAMVTVRESLEASADREDQDPYRAFALGILAELEGAGR
jgi:serine/threonine-protein kinase